LSKEQEALRAAQEALRRTQAEIRAHELAEEEVWSNNHHHNCIVTIMTDATKD